MFFHQVYFKHCAIQLKKSGTKIPRIELVEIGPSMDLVIRRHRLPNDDIRKEAMKSTSKSTKKKVNYDSCYRPNPLTGMRECLFY